MNEPCRSARGVEVVAALEVHHGAPVPPERKKACPATLPEQCGGRAHCVRGADQNEPATGRRHIRLPQRRSSVRHADLSADPQPAANRSIIGCACRAWTPGCRRRCPPAHERGQQQVAIVYRGRDPLVLAKRSIPGGLQRPQRQAQREEALVHVRHIRAMPRLSRPTAGRWSSTAAEREPPARADRGRCAAPASTSSMYARGGWNTSSLPPKSRCFTAVRRSSSTALRSAAHAPARQVMSPAGATGPRRTGHTPVPPISRAAAAALAEASSPVYSQWSQARRRFLRSSSRSRHGLPARAAAGAPARRHRSPRQRQDHDHHHAHHLPTEEILRRRTRPARWRIDGGQSEPTPGG